jgi:protease-4
MHPPPEPPRRRGGVAGVVGWVMSSLLVFVLTGSIILNVYLGVIVASLTTGPHERVYIDGDRRHRIVILPIEGLIDDRTAEFVHMSLEALRDRPPRAIVLRVDSGGGFVTPSDQIWKDLQDYRRDRPDVPIIASFGSTAASGGYYVAASADAIVAEPTTITGSIGVIAQAFTFNELLGNVGVTPEVVTSTDSTRKDLLNPMRPWTDVDRQKLRHVLDTAYERFVEVVHQGRTVTGGLTMDEVRALATGEFFTVDEAINLRLVDQRGYLLDAIELARARAGLPADATPRVVRMTRPRGFGFGGILSAPGVAWPTGEVTAEQLRRWMIELGSPTLLYGAGR